MKRCSNRTDLIWDEKVNVNPSRIVNVPFVKINSKTGHIETRKRPWEKKN